MDVLYLDSMDVASALPPSRGHSFAVAFDKLSSRLSHISLSLASEDSASVREPVLDTEAQEI